MIRQRNLIAIFLVSAVLGFPSNSSAVSPAFWNTDSFAEFSKGTLKGLSLSADGQLSLAPKFDSVFDSDQALIWSAVVDSKKNLFVGTGHDGKVFKVDANGTSSLFFDAAELDVLALALDAEQTLFVATSPDGKVYKVNSDGKASVFFDPEDKFIWDMAFDRKGNLFAATGNKGKIYKVNKEGKGEVFYDSGQSNIICLAIDDAGNVVAGSDPDGYLYRISADGKPFVVYDSTMREIHEVQLDSKGSIYFVAINGGSGGGITESKSTGSEGTSGDSVTVSLSLSGQSDKAAVVEETPTFRPPAGRGARRDSGNQKSGIFRVAPDNSVETLWASDSETIYGLHLRPDSTLLFSTGNKGRIYLLKSDRKFNLLLETTEEQTTKLVPAGNEIFACTSNLAKIYRLGAVVNTQGTYESEVKDTQGVSTWGTLHWRATVPEGASFKVYTRSGNTKKPDKSWSDWSKAHTLADGEAIQSPRARYIQYKGVFSTTNQSSASLDQISLPYLPQNLAPEMKAISILAPGLALQKLPGLSTPRSPATLVDQGSAEASGASDAITQGPSVSIPPRRTFQKGAQSFSWEAEDDNGDDLTYSVYFRGEKESEWRPLKKDVEDKFYTLEADSLPDGKYFVKVVASDSPSNPKPIALTAELVSAQFHVDNTAPQIQVANQIVQGRTAVVRFRASDLVSSLRKAEVSIDGKEWEMVFSVDGIVDSKTEEFEIKTGTLEPGEHSIALRVYDATGNVAIGKAGLLIK
jgi:sugar lactone lactonase YvrE